MIKGIHHIAIKCKGLENFEETVHFYRDILGLKMVRSWDEGLNQKAMFDTGSGMMEIFASGYGGNDVGSVHHFAFAVDSVEEHLEKCRKEGYEVTMEAKDLVLASGTENALPARIGFVRGPVGESVEFFVEKNL